MVSPWLTFDGNSPICCPGYLYWKSLDRDVFGNYWRLRIWVNLSYTICKKQMRRSACTSAQHDQRLCCSLPIYRSDTKVLTLRIFSRSSVALFRRHSRKAYFLMASDCMHKNVIHTWNMRYFMIFVRIRVLPGKNLLLASNIHASKWCRVPYFQIHVQNLNEKKKLKVQGVPQSQTADNTRHQEERKNDKN